MNKRDKDSSLSIVTGYENVEMGSIPNTSSRLPLESTLQLIAGSTFSKVKRRGREAGHA